MRMKTYMKNEKLINFVPFPRKDLTDFRDGVITPNEYDFYMRLRHSANPYGITSINTGGLVAEFHDRKWSDNYITKLLLSLKKKSFIYYDSRAGRRGSFNIKFRDFYLPSGIISTLDHVGKHGSVRGEEAGQVSTQSEAEQTIPLVSKNSKEVKDSISALVQQFTSNKCRGSNNDTETDKEKEINRSNERRIMKDILVMQFTPTSYEEQYCWEIAREIGEEKMDFLLGTYFKYGLSVIEEAVGEYRNLSAKKMAQIENTASYFNGIVEQVLMINGKKVKRPANESQTI